ncbi:MAG: hypothetical protein ACXWFB_08450, partial [Nitrososphaeraceae archaeon]
MNSSIKLLFLYLNFHKVDKLNLFSLLLDLAQPIVQLSTKSYNPPYFILQISTDGCIMKNSGF